MKRTKIVSIIVTHMETLLPMSGGMSMHRFSSSPGKLRAMLYMFLMVVLTIILLKTIHDQPFMFCVVAEFPSVKGSEARLAVDDEAGIEGNHLVVIVLVMVEMRLPRPC